jgi:streptomycin 6-kinase
VAVPHPGLAWAQGTEEGRAWLARLPLLVEECAERWSLRVGEPFPYAYASLALPATLPDGVAAVLKLCYPDRESEHEADALARWGGEGAVRLLAHDRPRRALLLERAVPGTPLSDLEPDAALDVLAGLLPRLWTPAGPPFRPLAEEAAWWSESLPAQWERAGRPFERPLLDAGLAALRELAPTQGEQVLLHQDLHAWNVLRAEREPWLAIDPKPLAGEREFGLAPIVRGAELGGSARDVLHRLDRLSSELGLDRERARGWALGQTLAWAGGEAAARHIETARVLARA